MWQPQGEADTALAITDRLRGLGSAALFSNVLDPEAL